MADAHQLAAHLREIHQPDGVNVIQSTGTAANPFGTGTSASSPAGTATGAARSGRRRPPVTTRTGETWESLLLSSVSSVTPAELPVPLGGGERQPAGQPGHAGGTPRAGTTVPPG